LPVDENVPLLCVVSRLVDIKGIDLITENIDKLMQNNLQLAVLGKGDLRYEGLLKRCEKTYPAKVKAVIAFNQDLSRKVYAASDIFLMPSKTEPCGLAQMIASRYGTVPVVHETGGLNDSIKDFGTGNGNGFTFANYKAEDFMYVVNYAAGVYANDKKLWMEYMDIVMKKDFSWECSAREYIALYKSVA
jgi:starch synthase